jgi:hypothetical protein
VASGGEFSDPALPGRDVGPRTESLDAAEGEVGGQDADAATLLASAKSGIATVVVGRLVSDDT